jgi:hypothetical protein
MTVEKLFKGKIKIKNSKKPKKSLDFKFETKDFSIDQVVMGNFCNIGFDEHEKRDLSCTHRQIIKHYQTLDPKTLKKYSAELIKSIKETNSDRIDIEASDAGTFICLTAIYSGRLPKNKEIFFHLSSSPIQLFPKTLVKSKTAGHGVSISFCQAGDSWLRAFHCLQKTPDYIEVSNGSFGEDQELLFG